MRRLTHPKTQLGEQSLLGNERFVRTYLADALPLKPPSLPSVLTAEALCLEVEGPGRGASEEAVNLLLENTYESHDLNIPMVMILQ